MNASINLRTLLLFMVLWSSLGCSLTKPPEWLSGFRVVRPAVAYEILRDNPDLLIVDLRTKAEYESEGHLKGAVNLPLETFSSSLPDLAPFFKTGFLIYCDHEIECCEQAVDQLRGNGFRYAFVLEGGFEAWSAQSFPVDPGANPDS